MLPRVSFQAFTRFCTADGQKTGKITNVSSLHVEDEDKCSVLSGFFYFHFKLRHSRKVCPRCRGGRGSKVHYGEGHFIQSS